MANQDFSLSGAVKVRPAQQKDAGPLHQFCFPEREQAEIADELKADLAKASQTHRLVAEVSGYPIGQISVKQDANDSEVATVGDLVVSGPFRQIGCGRPSHGGCRGYSSRRRRENARNRTP